MSLINPLQPLCCFSIPPENIRKPKGFLMFSGGIGKQHRGCNGLRKNIMRIGLKEWFAANEIKQKTKILVKPCFRKLHNSMYFLCHSHFVGFKNMLKPKSLVAGERSNYFLRWLFLPHWKHICCNKWHPGTIRNVLHWK